MADKYLHLRVHEPLRDKSTRECHVYDEDGNKLGILPATKIHGSNQL